MIYLASPYSHPDPAVREERYRAACRAAAALMRRGDAVYSPIAHTHGIAVIGDFDLSWDGWASADLHLMEACDQVVVLLLPGWDASIGIAAEVLHARSVLGLPVRYLDLDEIDEVARG